MRILQVAPPWFSVPPSRYGGTELVVSELTDGLVAAGHDVTLLASGASTTSARLVSVYDEPPTAELGDTCTDLLHVTAADDLGAFDVVHDHTLLGASREEARGTPHVVHTLHDPWTDRSRAVYRRLGGKVALVAISHAQAHHAPEIPVRAVIHHGVDVRRYPMRRRQEEALAFVGRASPDKGPLLAIEVAQRTGRPLHMAIKVDEPDEHRYWETVLEPATHRADVHVTFNATHAQKGWILSHAHAAILPIQWDEPSGLVMIEAMASGVPVITFARGVTPELVVDGVTGHLVDPRAWVGGLTHAVETAGELDPTTCRQHVATQFSRERMVDDYLDLYEQLAVPRFRRSRYRAVIPAPAVGLPGTRRPEGARPLVTP